MRRTFAIKHNAGWHVLAALLCLSASPLAAHAAGDKHEHGVAHLDVVIDGGVLTLHLDVPLDSLLGFEHRPRTAAERRAADALLKRLDATHTLWQPTAEAKCQSRTTTVDAPVLQNSKPAAGADAHDDLDATVEFQCAAPAKLAGVNLGLFAAFPRLQRIEVQVATPQGQFQRVLKRPATVLSLTR